MIEETYVSASMREQARNKTIPNRITFFLLSSFSMFCFFFIYDSPSPMYPGLENMFGGDYKSYHSLLYSAYALPNLFLPLIVSTLSVASGTRTMAYTYLLIVMGQSLTAIGALTKSFSFMVIGRFVIGLGGECFSVSQNKVLSSLFRNNEHGRVFAMSIAIAKVGSILSYLLLGRLIQFGVLTCALIGTLISIVGGSLVLLIDSKWERSEETKTEERKETHYLLPHILFITFLIACAVSPFSGSSSVILQKRLHISYETASRTLAIQEGISLVSVVLISMVTDKYGHRLSSIFLGTLLLILSHALIINGVSLYFLPSFLLGVSSGMIACCWPCIPLLICPTRLTTGLSILSCGINLAYTVCPPIISKITDSEFIFSEWYTVTICSMSAILSGYILFLNKMHKYGLNGTSHIKIYGEEEETVRGRNSSNPPESHGNKLFEEEEYNRNPPVIEKSTTIQS
ncbi:hypothetical protein NEFER03_2092 [Nematocida sp. LUAm3]|nr:hypothetical protein NEFER03_2092 [Nematocida sp. LUAm3]KAI5175656.1 hypothetical protein NEFER02_1543 [Nematocida sp. LUAm2]KAI5178562.1 hypothetical protein NEFER01_1698 [Nematocida sp. LUAm1]